MHCKTISNDYKPLNQPYKPSSCISQALIDHCYQPFLTTVSHFSACENCRNNAMMVPWCLAVIPAPEILVGSINNGSKKFTNKQGVLLVDRDGYPSRMFNSSTKNKYSQYETMCNLCFYVYMLRIIGYKFINLNNSGICQESLMFFTVHAMTIRQLMMI